MPARPLASRALFAAVIAAVRAGSDAAIPALAVVDTVKRIDGNRVIDTVPPRRSRCGADTSGLQGRAVARAAHAGDALGTDDAALVEAGGGTVVVPVPGERRGNLKLTVAADLELAQALLDTGSGA